MPADIILDVYIQMALIELGFYIMFWHMMNIRKNYRVLFVLSYFFFVFYDYVIYGAAKLGNEFFFSQFRAIAISISLLFYFWICKDNFWKILAGVAFSDLLGGISHLFVAYSTKENMDKLTISFAPELPYIPLGIILGEIGFVVLFLILHEYLIYFSREPMEKKLWVRIFSVFYMSNILFPIINVHSELVFSHDQSWKLGAGWSALILITQMIALYCDKKQTQRQKNYYLRQQNQILKWHYETLREQIAFTHKFRRDVSEILGDGRLWGKCAEERRRRSDDENIGNEIVNQILVNKKNQCLEANIQFQTELDNISFSDKEEMDMVTILYNMLDNAIEGCLRVADMKRRWITLTIRQEKESLSICCENSRQGEMMLAKGKRTWKKDKLLHGLGMEIIESVVEKYHGVCNYEEREEDFFFQIILPWSERNV